MPLTGKAKTDYMREYMRKRRSNKKKGKWSKSVRPKQENVRPTVITKTDIPGNCSTMEIMEVIQQSINPMMVGYVPPR